MAELGPEHPTMLALDRTALAHERTMLAWLRTSLGLIGFGLGLAKLTRIFPALEARVLSFALVFIGLVVLAISAGAFRTDMLRLMRLGTPRRGGTAFLTAVVLTLVGAIALAMEYIR